MHRRSHRSVTEIRRTLLFFNRVSDPDHSTFQDLTEDAELGHDAIAREFIDSAPGVTLLADLADLQPDPASADHELVADLDVPEVKAAGRQGFRKSSGADDDI